MRVFSFTGPPRRIDCLAPQPVCHIKIEASRYVHCQTTQQASLPACSPRHPYCAERQAAK